MAPHFGPMPRDGKLQLGNIFDHPLKVYDFPISRPTEPVPSTRSARRDISKLIVNKSGTWGAELWARFLATFRYSVDARTSQELSMHYRDIRTVHTEEFDPRPETMQEYVNRRIINEPELGRRLDQTSIFSRPVYMVIGIQYAMSMTYELIGHSSGQGRVAAEGPIVPDTESGATMDEAGVNHFGLETTINGEFVFAYQMLEVRPKGLKWARPPAAVWGGDGALDDDEEDKGSYEGVVDVQEKNRDAAGEESRMFVETDTFIFQEEDVIRKKAE